MANDTSEQLFNFPPNKYVASLFKEVNELELELFKASAEGKVLIYPTEIKLSENGNLTAKVIKSYFNGTDYFVEAETNNEQKIYFNSAEFLEASAAIHLHVDEELLQQRKVKD